MRIYGSARPFAVAGAGLIGLLLAACGDGSSSGSAGAKTTAMYSPHMPGESRTTGTHGTSAPPVITGSAPGSVTVGQAYHFQPQASDPARRTLTFSIENQPAWTSFDSSSGLLAGTPAPADIGTDANVRISVSDGVQSAALPAFSITVGGAAAPAAVTVSWDAPTQYTDGAPLTDLAGYHIHYGTQSQSYTQTIQVANPGLTSYAVQNLPAGTYYFAVSAYDSAGAESDYSAEATATVD